MFPFDYTQTRREQGFSKHYIEVFEEIACKLVCSAAICLGEKWVIVQRAQDRAEAEEELAIGASVSRCVQTSRFFSGIRARGQVEIDQPRGGVPGQVGNPPPGG